MYTLFCELLKVPKYPLSENKILPFIKYLALGIRLKQSFIKVKIMNLKKEKKNKKNIHIYFNIFTFKMQVYIHE